MSVRPSLCSQATLSSEQVSNVALLTSKMYDSEVDGNLVAYALYMYMCMTSLTHLIKTKQHNTRGSVSGEQTCTYPCIIVRNCMCEPGDSLELRTPS